MGVPGERGRPHSGHLEHRDWAPPRECHLDGALPHPRGNVARSLAGDHPIRGVARGYKRKVTLPRGVESGKVTPPEGASAPAAVHPNGLYGACKFYTHSHGPYQDPSPSLKTAPAEPVSFPKWEHEEI